MKNICVIISISSYILMTTNALSKTLSDNKQGKAYTAYYQENEELQYEVSWSGINIGSIRLKSLPVAGVSYSGKRKAVAYIDSRSGLPFVDVHMVAYTEMDSFFNSLGSYSYEKQENGWQKVIYNYYLSENIIVVEEATLESLDSKPLHHEVYDTLRISGTPVQDGISLVYMGRYLSQAQDSISYLTVSNEKIGVTQFYISRPRSKVNIKAWVNPISVVELSGKMKLRGIFGLSGDFIGWFSNDQDAVPIIAEMKVLLGSIRIELTHWNRKGWHPPE